MSLPVTAEEVTVSETAAAMAVVRVEEEEAELLGWVEMVEAKVEAVLEVEVRAAVRVVVARAAAARAAGKVVAMDRAARVVAEKAVATAAARVAAARVAAAAAVDWAEVGWAAVDLEVARAEVAMVVVDLEADSVVARVAGVKAGEDLEAAMEEEATAAVMAVVARAGARVEVAREGATGVRDFCGHTNRKRKQVSVMPAHAIKRKEYVKSPLGFEY